MSDRVGIEFSRKKNIPDKVSTTLKEYHDRYKAPEVADIKILAEATGFTESYIRGVLRLSVQGYLDSEKGKPQKRVKKKAVVYMDGEELEKKKKKKLKYFEEKPPILSKSDLAIREYDKIVDAGEKLNITALAKKLQMARSTVTRALEKARPEYKEYLGKAKK